VKSKQITPTPFLLLLTLACLGLLGCERNVTADTNVAAETIGTVEVDVTKGMGGAEILAVKGKPLSIVSSGNRSIVRWSDVVIRFENEVARHIEVRNHAREEAIRLRSEKAAAELRAHQAAKAERAAELRHRTERENEAYLLKLEVEKQNEIALALQEDVRMRRSSFGPMPSLYISCPSEIRERTGLSFPSTSFSGSSSQPWLVGPPKNRTYVRR